MKITIKCEAKEIAEFRVLALPVERLIDSKITDAKEQIIGEITNTLSAAITFSTARLDHWTR